MIDALGGGGLRSALLPARLMQLAGGGRLASVHAILDSLRTSRTRVDAGMACTVRNIITEHLPFLGEQGKSIDLVDHQNQDIPLAIFLLTHPALPRRAIPLLLLRTLAAWDLSDLARLYRVKPDRVQSKLNAGLRRIRILGLEMAWPHLKELNGRTSHAIDVIEQLDAVGRHQRSRRLIESAASEHARSFLEALAENPITRTPWVVERCWRIRYAGALPTEEPVAKLRDSGGAIAAVG
jgi:hypothetical protein